VTVHYVGTVSFFFLASFSIKTITILHLPFHLREKLLDGTKFDSSRDKGRTFNFYIGTKQVIRGTFLFQRIIIVYLSFRMGRRGGYHEQGRTRQVGHFP